MSTGLQRLFGKKKDEKSSTADAIQKLREMEELLTKRQQFLEKKVLEELKLAKQHGTKNKRRKCVHDIAMLISFRF